jgi:hypothetical protein
VPSVLSWGSGTWHSQAMILKAPSNAKFLVLLLRREADDCMSQQVLTYEDLQGWPRQSLHVTSAPFASC